MSVIIAEVGDVMYRRTNEGFELRHADDCDWWDGGTCACGIERLIQALDTSSEPYGSQQGGQA